VFAEGTTLDALDSVDSRRYLPAALIATLVVIVLPAVVVVQLSPLSGIADLLLSAVLATGLSVLLGSICSTLWTRRPESREIAFGDLMLWAWARRVRAERKLAKVAAEGDGDATYAGRELTALRRLSVVYEARDGFTHGHSGRIARHSERIARRLGLPDAEVEQIEAAAAVHDVGMVRIPRAIAAKGGELTPDEQGLVERHAIYGGEQVSAVADPAIAAIVRHHHESFDGSGYPDGLAGDEIPLGARIVAVAESFDELVSAGPQRAPTSRRNALDTLSERAGTQLDPVVVAAFVSYYSGVRSIAGAAFAATAPQRLVRWVAAAPAGIGSAVGTPALIQGVCAAGTLALAGSCLTGLPASGPERDGDRPAARQADRAPASVAGGEGQTVAAADPQTGAGKDADGRRGSGDGGDGAPVPGSGQPQGGSGGGGDAPATPPNGGGGSQPGGGGGGGGSTPASPAPSTPSSPAELPELQAPELPDDPTSGIVDPVLDGLGEALPPAKPLTDTLKGVVGGVTQGLGGGSSSP
jgi:hypothetical protein